MSGAFYVLLYSSIICAFVGALSIAVASRERRRGSSGWGWLLPGAFGVILLVVCALRLVFAA